MLGSLSVIGLFALSLAGGWRFGVLGGIASGGVAWALIVITMAVNGEAGGDFYAIGAGLTLILFVVLGLAGAAFRRVIRAD